MCRIILTYCLFWALFRVFQVSFCDKGSSLHANITTNFCEHKCRLKYNICCLYDYTKLGTTCGHPDKIKVIDFNDRELEIILDMHNRIRNAVAGGAGGAEVVRNDLKGITAANMHVMSYSRKLAFSAGCWARQCVYGHSRCRAIEEGELGETMCFKIISAQHVDDMRVNILIECPRTIFTNFPHFTKDRIDSFDFIYEGDDERNRETVQLLWAISRFVGCYRIEFSHGKAGAIGMLIVCHYWPKGNIEKKPIFLMGKPCSKCHQNETCGAQYPNLCGDIIPYENDHWLGPAKANKISNTKVVFLLILRYFVFALVVK